MSIISGSAQEATTVRVEALGDFCRAAFKAVGADDATAEAATRAMMHASTLGVDSHGIRLLDHYLRALKGGRLNRQPRLRLVSERGATGVLDADDAQGALAAYTAMEHALRLARQNGIGSIAIRNSSHFGAAGAFALAAAEAGCIGLVTCNADKIVRLHDGAAPFHGTNPIAVAVPVPDGRPWLFDMATSSIPFNRVLLFRGLGQPLPEATASDETGIDTSDPHRAAMLAPLGGAEFGFKGAGLAGLSEILSAGLSGMALSHKLLPMGGPDFSTPRKLGAFVLAIDPDAFLPREAFAALMRRYIDALRGSPARPGEHCLAPGDREWAEASRRRRTGVPLDPDTVSAFRRLAAEHALPLPFA